MRKPAVGIDQRRRFGRILLRLDNEPAVVICCLERSEHCGKIDRAVTWHGEDAIEHGVEKALIGGAHAGQHTRPDILAVDMVDARSMPPRNIGRVGAGKGQMPGVEQQTDAAAGRRHQAVDVGRGLDDRPHVVMIGEADTLIR